MARVDPHPTWVRLHSGMNLWGWEGLPVDPTKAKTVDRGLQFCVCTSSCGTRISIGDIFN